MIFIEKFIDKKIVKKINYVLNQNKINYLSSVANTHKGQQSENIVYLFDQELFKKFIPFNFGDKVFYIHYIKYEKGGYQLPHNHAGHEDYSFLLYLNQGTGDTVFKFKTFTYTIKPDKGKFIFFSSHILHEAKEVKTKKEILVGSIKNV